MDPARCANCLYWHYTGMEAHGGYEGECRRFPPEGNSDHREWPATNASDWCGEYWSDDQGLDEDDAS